MADEKVNLQSVVDCYQGTEQAIFEAIAENALTMQCLDQAARNANAAGYEIRSFELSLVQTEHAKAGKFLTDALAAVQKAHGLANRQAVRLEIPVPQPKTGGR